MRCPITNSFIILKDSYGDDIRLAPDEIAYYKQEGHFTSIFLKSGGFLSFQITVGELDQALTETLFMIKKAYAANDISQR